LPAFIFPGQGFQRPEMGRPWQDHPSWDVVQDASDVAGRDIESLLLDAGTEELGETRNAQLATFVMGLVVLDAVERLGIEPTACAGHSLGEYTALVAGGAIGFEDAVRLVAERGEAMQEAADENPGIMLAVGGIDDELARIACRRADGDVWLANSNAPGECVIAGRPAEVRRAVDIARELGATRVADVAVSGAFHTPLMAPAQPRLRKALETTTFFPLAVPVVANVDALPHTEVGEWRTLLSAQLRSPVRWRQSAESLAAIMRAGEWDGDNLFCELGPGGQLSAMVRATVPEATTIPISVPDDLDVLVARLTGDSALEGAEISHQGERLYVSERLIISPCAGIFQFPPGVPAGASAPGAAVPGAVTPGAESRGAESRGAESRGGSAPVGTPIEIGDLVGLVSGTEVRSPFAGDLMGVLAHPGERVQPGQPIAWLRAR
jgi:[acyl-carrier-protein] S-malonyltransferase